MLPPSVPRFWLAMRAGPAGGLGEEREVVCNDGGVCGCR